MGRHKLLQQLHSGHSVAAVAVEVLEVDVEVCSALRHHLRLSEVELRLRPATRSAPHAPLQLVAIQLLLRFALSFGLHMHIVHRLHISTICNTTNSYECRSSFACSCNQNSSSDIMKFDEMQRMKQTETKTIVEGDFNFTCSCWTCLATGRVSRLPAATQLANAKVCHSVASFTSTRDGAPFKWATWQSGCHLRWSPPSRGLLDGHVCHSVAA